jgi:hypothetical protein
LTRGSVELNSARNALNKGLRTARLIPPARQSELGIVSIIRVRTLALAIRRAKTSAEQMPEQLFR